MEIAFWIWLYLFIGNLGWIVVASGVACAALMLASIGVYDSVMGASDGVKKLHKRLLKWSIVSVFVTGLIASAYPSPRDLQWIIGGAVTYHVIQNEEVQKLPENLLKATNTFLEGIHSPEEILNEQQQ